ncbi:MAG: MotA/TolQ/ExbB proton channel family protein [Acaryochloridaceae cyanobacterium RU_4_10]|nr:MotA/TolQ/ExbB proton channel family protein [Acaryochloridaceae cyanobacterium RU_4_10]
MQTVYDLFIKGGPVMWPLFGLSVATCGCAIERAVFWIRLLSQEHQVVHDVLTAAQVDLNQAAEIAQQSNKLPIGRFLLAPLQLRHPSPETFRLALESTGDQEFVYMRRGNKLLETVVAISPLLGLLGTVTGLILTFDSLKIGGGGSVADMTNAASGIGEALMSTATGMVVAIVALLFFRVFVSLQANQVDYFTQVGSKLELIYRQIWYEPYLAHPNPPWPAPQDLSISKDP